MVRAVRPVHRWIPSGLYVLLVTLGTGLAAPFARGGEPTVGPESGPSLRGGSDACSGPGLEARVRALLGSSEVSVNDVVAQADLRRLDNGWRLELTLTRNGDVAGVRTFVAADCHTVLAAAAFVVAVTLDPSSATRDVSTSREAEDQSSFAPSGRPPSTQVPPPAVMAVDPTGSADTVTGSPSAAEADAVQTASRKRATGGKRAAESLPSAAVQTKPASEAHPASGPGPRKSPIGGLVWVGGGIDGAALPSAAAVFQGGAGVRSRFYRVEAIVLSRLQSTVRARRDPEVGARLSQWTVGVRGCGVPEVRRFEFPLCAGLEGGQVKASGFGFADRRTIRRPWGAAVVGAGAIWVINPHAALTLQATLGLAFVRTRLVVENLEELHLTGTVFGRGLIGFEARFP